MLLFENDDSITARKFPRLDLGTLILVVEMCNCWLGVLEVVSKESDHAILVLDQGLSGIGGDVMGGWGEERGGGTREVRDGRVANGIGVGGFALLRPVNGKERGAGVLGVGALNNTWVGLRAVV
jgi:hypothetical protein